MKTTKTRIATASFVAGGHDVVVHTTKFREGNAHMWLTTFSIAGQVSDPLFSHSKKLGMATQAQTIAIVTAYLAQSEMLSAYRGLAMYARVAEWVFGNVKSDDFSATRKDLPPRASVPSVRVPANRVPTRMSVAPASNVRWLFGPAVFEADGRQGDTMPSPKDVA